MDRGDHKSTVEMATYEEEEEGIEEDPCNGVTTTGRSFLKQVPTTIDP